MDVQPEDEVRRLTQLLDMLVRLSRRTRRSLEDELGLGSAGLSKILSGTTRLQVSHILMITAALGVQPGEFFRTAYPDGMPRSAAIKSLRAALGMDPDAEQEEVSPPQFEERVKQALLHLLGVDPRELLRR